MTRVLMLAAGLSSRAGGNKLLMLVEGEPMIRRSLRPFAAIGADILVVVGHEAARVEEAIGDLAVRVVSNPSYTSGMGSSIVIGAQHAGEASGLLIALGDMPSVAQSHVETMLRRAQNCQPDTILASSTGDFETPPVWLGAQYFEELAGLSGDSGAGALLRRHAGKVERIIGDPRWFRDIDTFED